jgi:hypothetical protein
MLARRTAGRLRFAATRPCCLSSRTFGNVITENTRYTDEHSRFDVELKAAERPREGLSKGSLVNDHDQARRPPTLATAIRGPR